MKQTPSLPEGDGEPMDSEAAFRSLRTSRLTPAQVAEWCNEPFLKITERGVGALYDPTPTLATLAALQEGLEFGSRKGGVYLYVLACQVQRGDPDAPNCVLAWLAAKLWVEGKRRSALDEFDLVEEWDIDSWVILDHMAPFRGTSVIMEPDEITALEALPERFTVWRGGTGPIMRLRKGFSWTLDKAVAQWFADNCDGEERHLVWRRPLKSDVIAYFGREREVVLRPRGR